MREKIGLWLINKVLTYVLPRHSIVIFEGKLTPEEGESVANLFTLIRYKRNLVNDLTIYN